METKLHFAENCNYLEIKIFHIENEPFFKKLFIYNSIPNLQKKMF